jgi:hypothetical protein
MNLLSQDMDTLHSQHQGTLNQLDLYQQKNEDDTDILDRQKKHFDELKATLNRMISAITTFSNNFNSLSETSLNYRGVISKRFRDIICLYQNLQAVQELYSIEDTATKIEEVLIAIVTEFEVQKYFNL